MLYLQIASPKSSVLNFLDSNSFEVIISIFQRTEKVPDMERLRNNVMLSANNELHELKFTWYHKHIGRNSHYVKKSFFVRFCQSLSYIK